MINTTYQELSKYRITDTLTFDFVERDVFTYIRDSLTETSSVIEVDIIAQTYGKYVDVKVNLIRALLEEHKAERDREN